MKIIKFIVVFPFMFVVLFFRSMWLTIGILTYEEYTPSQTDVEEYGFSEKRNYSTEAPQKKCNSGTALLAGLLLGYFFFDD